MVRIQKATEAGLDAHGKKLRPYSAAYIKAIQAGQVRGHNGVRKTNTATTLRITNDLMNSMQVKATPQGAELFFSGSHATGSSGGSTKPKKEKSGGGSFAGGSRLGAAKSKRIGGNGKRIGAIAKKAIESMARRRGATGSIPNSQLAGMLESRGFTGWFEWGEEDLKRLDKTFGDLLDKVLDKMVVVRRS